MATEARNPYRSIFALMAALAVGLSVVPVAAQGGIASEKSDHEALTAESLVADQLIILARQAMGGGELNAARLTATEVMLSLALDLQPHNAELWRLWMEWARMAEDDAALRKGLDVYTTLRPSDDRAALELIGMQVRERQTIEQRMRMLEDLVSRSVGRLGPALRSRLASMIASMAFDHGDDVRLARYLPQAVQLDPTNAEAAKLLLAFSQTREASNAQMGRALTANLRATPLEWGYRSALASLLLKEHAFEAAAEQFDVAQRLAGALLDDEFYWQWALALAWSGRTDEAVALIDDLEQRVGPDQAEVPASSPTAPDDDHAEVGTVPPDAASGADGTGGASGLGGLSGADGPDGADEADAALDMVADTPVTPETPSVGVASGLSYRLRILRLVLLKGQGRDARIRTLANQVRAKWGAAAEAGDVDRIWQLGLFLAIGGVDLGYVNDLAARLDDQTASARATLRGWRALAMGEAVEAVAHFEFAVGQSDATRSVELGLAMARFDVGGSPDALGQLFNDEATPDETLLLAAGRLTATPARLLAITRTGRQMVQGLEALGTQIRDPKPVDERWTFLRLDADASSFAYLEPLTVTVTLQNVTRMPLALRPDGPMPKAVIVHVATRVGGAAAGQFRDLVIDLGRRLRLEPGEKITVPARLDWSQLGEQLAATPTQTMSIDAAGLLDLRATPDGGMVSGPLGTRAVVRLISRRGAALNEINVEAWLRTLDDPDSAERLRAAARLTHVAGAMAQQETTDEAARALLRRMTSAVTDGYPTLDRLGRAMVVRFLPLRPEDGSPSPFETIHDLAQRSDDTLVQVMYLAANVVEPADPALEAAQISDVPDVSRFAMAWADVLAQRKVMAEKAAERRAAAEQAAEQAAAEAAAATGRR